MNRPFVSGLGWAAALLTVSAAGCGKGDFATATVTGRVVHQGQGVPDVGVSFAPKGDGKKTSPGKPAIGVSDASGNFALSTYEEGDGAVVGQHQVSLSRDPEKGDLPGKTPENLMLEVKPGENAFEIELK
jgi:hypothetical protein